MKAIRRILVGVKDPGARSSPAVHKAACLAEAFGAELVLFHAIAVPVAAAPYLYTDGDSTSSSRTCARRTWIASSAAPRAAQRQRQAEGAGRRGLGLPVHEAIVRHARKIKADLVVAEAHAGRRLVPWLLHLTDWELLRTCPVPVLIVKSSREVAASARARRDRSAARVRKARGPRRRDPGGRREAERGAQGKPARDACLRTDAQSDDADHRRELERRRENRGGDRRRRRSRLSTARCARRGFRAAAGTSGSVLPRTRFRARRARCGPASSSWGRSRAPACGGSSSATPRSASSATCPATCWWSSPRDS